MRTDRFFQDHIHPFIEDSLSALKRLDEDRAAYVRDNLPADYDMTYRFYEHSQNAAADMRRTAASMGLADNVQENLYWAMLAHDIGKTKLPANIWDQVEKPEAETKALRRRHIDYGADILDDAFGDTDHPFLTLLRDIILYHHELIDGSGPKGRTGDQLSAPVRLACIIESFDGYATPRYHFGDRDVSVAGVLKRMRDEKGARHYDMVLFEHFATMKIREADKPS